MDDSSTPDSQPPITPTTTPAQPAAPFDPDTLPPHLRAGLDHLSDLRYEMMALIVRRRAEQVAQAAQAAQAARTS